MCFGRLGRRGRFIWSTGPNLNFEPILSHQTGISPKSLLTAVVKCSQRFKSLLGPNRGLKFPSFSEGTSQFARGVCIRE